MSTWMRRRIERSRARCHQAAKSSNPEPQPAATQSRPDEQTAPPPSHAATS